MANSRKPSANSKKSSLKKEALSLNSFEKKVLRFSEEQNLWQPGQSLLLAISGGPDSICLLFVMLKLAQLKNLKLSVAHINYRLRDKDSEADVLLVKQLALKHKLPFFTASPSLNTKKDEQNLREFRYTFFDKLTSKKNFDALVLGHHADDQVETFLLRLLRGSGPEGLQAMLPKDQSRVRPLLFLWKKEIITYLKKRDITYRLDVTNEQSIYTRNKIRHLLIPYLEKEYQPQIKKILYQTAHTLQQAHSNIPTIIPLGVLDIENTKTFSAESFLLLSPHEQSLFFRKILSFFLVKPISKSLYEEVLKMLKSNKNKTQTMTFHGLKLTKKGATVSLQKTQLN